MLLLHAGVCDRRMWEPQWARLVEAGYRVVRADFRGYGETAAPDGPYDDAEDVVELLDELGVGQVTVVGASFGGRVALEVAARWPERVRAMALLCSALAGHEPSATLRAFAEREEALLDAGDVEGAVELNVDTWVGPDADPEARDAVRRMQRLAFDIQLAAEEPEQPRPEFDISAVQAPCLVVSGGHDLPDFQDIADQLYGLLPDAARLHLPWAGHLPSMERPAAVTELLVGFLHDRA